jgi:hypothetical protein
MQRTIFVQDVYIMKANQLFKDNKVVARVRKESIIKTLQDLRALAYASLGRLLVDYEGAELIRK